MLSFSALVLTRGDLANPKAKKSPNYAWKSKFHPYILDAKVKSQILLKPSHKAIKTRYKLLQMSFFLHFPYWTNTGWPPTWDGEGGWFQINDWTPVLNSSTDYLVSLAAMYQYSCIFCPFITCCLCWFSFVFFYILDMFGAEIQKLNHP